MTDPHEVPTDQHGSIVTGGPLVILPTRFGSFEMRAWADALHGVDHLSLSSPGSAGIHSAEPPLVRIHSECLTGDVFGSFRCDCGEQLAHALELIAREGGTLIYLRGQEGRGIGLANKVHAYALQDAGADTLDANLALGLPADARDYTAATQILRALDISSVRLLSNNPQKAAALQAGGINVTELVPSHIPPRPENQRYLQSKRDRFHHLLGNLDVNPTINSPQQNGSSQ